MTRMFNAMHKYAASLMLAAVVVWGGAKSPSAFCAWGLAALGWAMFVVKYRTPERHAIGFFLAFNAGVLLSQVYSLDPANSLFWTVQSIIFSCLWLALQAASPFPDEISSGKPCRRSEQSRC